MNRAVSVAFGALVCALAAVPSAADVIGDGAEFQVNTYTTGNQSNYYMTRSVAKTPDGRYIVVWRDQRDGENDVYAQRFGPDGSRMAPPFLVNEHTTGIQLGASVIARTDSSFVVVWSSYDDQDGGYASVQGKLFDSNGESLTGEFQINTYTTDDQTQARACSAADDTFVIVWASGAQDGDQAGVFGQRYDSSAAPVGTEFQVNEYTTSTQWLPEITCAHDGRFIVAWTTDGQDGDGNGAEARRFDSDGTPAGSEFQVNSISTGHQYVSDIDGPGDGSFVVTGNAQDIAGDAWGVFARQFDDTGAALGSEFHVNAYTTGTQGFSSVAFDPDGGFVIVWESYPRESDDSAGIFAQAYDSAGAPAGGEFHVNSYEPGHQKYPNISADDAGHFVVVWTDISGRDGDNGGLFGQRLCGDSNADSFCDGYEPNPGAPADGSEFQVNSYTTSDQSIYYFHRSVSKSPDGHFIVVWTDDRDGDSNIYGRRFAADGSAIGTDFLVNEHTTGGQAAASVQARPDGSFVVAWNSYDDQDGGYGSVQGRVFGADGTPAVGEFQINTYTTENQSGARLCSANDGSFVAVWESRQDGDQDGIFGQRYDSAGARAGTEFAVNQYTTSDQWGAHVMCAGDGKFVAAWTSVGQDGDGNGGEARRFASDGTPLGPEFQVNSASAGQQYVHDIDGPGDGSFVVVGLAQNIDGDLWGVGARRFDASGTPLGSEFRVNTFTAGIENYASVAVAPDGTFVTVWQGYHDGDGAGIYGQSYDASGARAGGEFLVNSYTTDDQAYPEVASDAGGNFVVVWASTGQDGDGRGMFGQRYCRDSDHDLTCDGAYLPETVTETVAPGGTVTSDPEGDGATPADPIETSITSPNGGEVSVGEEVVSVDPPIIEITIDAPDATVADPLVLVFRIDATLASSFTIRRNGVAIELECSGTAGTASPDPCIDDITTLPDGDQLVTVLTSHASVWRLEGSEPGICPSSPSTGCLTGEKASFQLKDGATDAKDQIKWKLNKAQAFTQAALGNPAMSRAYALCIYDQTAGSATLESTVRVDANSRWTSKDPKGFAYKDKAGLEDGVTKATLRSGLAGKTMIAVAAKGDLIPMPTPHGEQYFDQDTKVIVQLVNSETSLCWTSEFTSASKNEAGQFKAKTP